MYVVPLETRKSDDNENNHYRLQTGKGMLDRKELQRASQKLVILAHAVQCGQHCSVQAMPAKGR